MSIRGYERLDVQKNGWIADMRSRTVTDHNSGVTIKQSSDEPEYIASM